jgi:perosamine synthetase
MLDKKITEFANLFENFYRKDTLPISLSVPKVNEKDISFVQSVLQEGWLSTAGPYTQMFEDKISSVFDDLHVAALNSGTSALHMSLNAIGIEENDEVLTTPLTFIAPINTIRYLNANPIFIDISRENLAISKDKIIDFAKKNFKFKNNITFNKITKNPVKALLLVDVYGLVPDYEFFRNFCSEYNLKLIVDSSESLGSNYKMQTSASFSDLSVTSFNGNKIITTGSGGAVISSNEDLISKIKHISTTANSSTVPYLYQHDQVGYNYRLPSINAALGISQLDDLENRVKFKRKLHEQYKEKINEINGVSILSESKETQSNYWLNFFYFDTNQDKDFKNLFLEALNNKGIGARAVWDLANSFKYLSKFLCDDLENAKFMYSHGFNLPSGLDVDLY